MLCLRLYKIAITPCSKEANSSSDGQDVMAYRVFYGTAVHYRVDMKPSLFVPWGKTIKSTPPSHRTSLRSTLILSSKQRPGVPSCLSLRISLPKAACTFLPSPTNLTVPYLINLIIFSEQYQSWRSSLCNLLQSPISCCFLPLSTRSLTSAHRHSAVCPNAQHDRPIHSCGRSRRHATWHDITNKPRLV